jgi:hypothetical protein
VTQRVDLCGFIKAQRDKRETMGEGRLSLCQLGLRSDLALAVEFDERGFDVEFWAGLFVLVLVLWVVLVSARGYLQDPLVVNRFFGSTTRNLAMRSLAPSEMLVQ